MSRDRDEADEERAIVEDYKTWKKNTPFLYDVVLSHALQWPSLTTQWLPVSKDIDGKDYSEHKMVLGTYTSENEPNHLMIARVRLPKPDVELDVRQYDEERGELGGYGGDDWKVDIEVRINHPGEVNRARYCPGNVFMIATKANSGDVLVFDYSKHASSPKDTLFRPQVRCKGHDKVGYGLSWHPSVSGTLLSGAEDGSICIWDVQSGGGSKSADSAAASSTSASSSSAASGGAGGSAAGFAACTELQPLHKLAAHGGMCVNDVAWHRHNRDIFASVGDDRGLAIWDVRTLSGKAAPTHTVDAAHSNDAMSVSFNPFQEFLLITGGKDSLVKLWDTRTLRAPMHVFEGHQKAVGTVAFSPFDEGVFASAGEDRRVMVWDCSRIGEEQTDEDKEDGPPELLFIHGGHTERVSDFSWNEHPDAEWFVSSVADDNILQVWQMASNIYIRDEEEGYADGAGVDDGEVE